MIKNAILDIKLRDRPVTNISHNEKCANGGHAGHVSKYLIVFMTMPFLTDNNASFLALKRTIRMSLIPIDPLTCDGTDIGWEMRSPRAAISSAIACYHSG